MTAQRSALLLVCFAGCTGSTPKNEIDAPDPERITVFFPTFDGTVYGRGLPGAFKDPKVQYAWVDSRPSGYQVRGINVQQDGSFEFNLSGISEDTLEIRGVTDETGKVTGDSTFIKVPIQRFSPEEAFCCLEANRPGVCEKKAARDIRLAMLMPCPAPSPGSMLSCMNDNECGVLEDEFLVIDPNQVTITPPNDQGQVRVSGTVTPNALVTLENRQFNGIGVPTRPRRSTQISSDGGAFDFSSVVARGDDELVLTVTMLNGYRSAATSFKVPDAEMAGVDVVGADAWEGTSALRNGYNGTIALYLSPFGVDGRGICPDSDLSPSTCWSGGLNHDKIAFVMEGEQPTIDEIPVTPIPSVPQPGTPGLEYNVGWDGDVRAPGQDLVVVLDMSSRAAELPTAPQRFQRVRRLIEDLRARDRVGVVLFGGKNTMGAGFGGQVTWEDPKSPNVKIPKAGIRWLGVPEANVGQGNAMRSAADRQILIDELGTLTDEFATNSEADLLDGLRSAVDMLKQAKSVRGRIIAIAATALDSPDAKFDPTKKIYDQDHFDQMNSLTKANPRLGSAGITVDLVDLNPTEKANEDITTMVAFSGSEGGVVLETNLDQLESTLIELRRRIAGSFFLLYDLCIPKSVGKRPTFEFRLRVSLDYQDPVLGNQTVTLTTPPIGQKAYSFPIKVDGSDGGGCIPGAPDCPLTCAE